jgi:hypothetical protein
LYRTSILLPQIIAGIVPVGVAPTEPFAKGGTLFRLAKTPVVDGLCVKNETLSSPRYRGRVEAA